MKFYFFAATGVFGFLAKLTAAGSVFEELCLNGEAISLSLEGIVRAAGQQQQVTPILISFEKNDSSVLHQHETYPFAVDQEYSEMMIWTESGEEDADVLFKSLTPEENDDILVCHGSNDHARVWWVKGKTLSAKFVGTGNVAIDVLALLESGEIAVGQFASRITGREQKQTVSATQDMIPTAETKLRSALDGAAEEHRQQQSAETTRHLSWSYASFLSAFQPSTPRPTPVPTPTAQTFAPTTSLAPTSTMSPTYAEPCDFGVTCDVDATANVEIAGYLFACRALIEFSHMGLVAPDVCEAERAAVQESCVCAGQTPTTSVRTAARDKSKRIYWTPPTPAPTEKTLAFSYPTCEVCHADEHLPLVISGMEFRCSDLRYYGSMGFFPPDLCPVAQRHAQDDCGCSPDKLRTNRSSEREPYSPSLTADAGSFGQVSAEASLGVSSATTVATGAAGWLTGAIVVVALILR